MIITTKEHNIGSSVNGENKVSQTKITSSDKTTSPDKTTSKKTSKKPSKTTSLGKKPKKRGRKP